MNDDIYLVKLPPFKGISKDFYGIGRKIDGDFDFVLIHPEMYNKYPSRLIRTPEYGKESNQETYEVIGKIESLP